MSRKPAPHWINFDGSTLLASVEALYTDNCGTVTATFDSENSSISGDNCGWTAVYSFDVEDECENTTTCTVTYSGSDTEPPTIDCSGELTVYLRENGEYVLNSYDMDILTANISDNCTDEDDISLTVFPRYFECIHVGEESVPVTITASDECGNSASCKAQVTVIDTIPPVALCRDRTFYLGESGKVTITPFDIDKGGDRASVPEWARTYNPLEGGSYDACGIETATLSQYFFTKEHVGENIVTLTVFDPSGNSDSCQAIVTILDTIPPPPTITCPEDIVVSNDEGECGAIVTFAAQSDFDITYEPAQGSFFPIGTTTVTATATNSLGESASCDFTVTVTDDEDPVISCPEDITVTAEKGLCEADVIVPAPVEVSDNCGNTTYSNDFNSGLDASDTYPAGNSGHLDHNR